MKFFAAFSILCLVSLQAIARPIELTVSDYGWATSLPPVRAILDFYLQGVEDDLNEDQPILDPSRVNYGTANSTVLASKGIGTDYTLPDSKLYLALSAGAAWDAEKNVGIKNEISGVGAASGLTVGTKLKDRIMGYVSFGVFELSHTFPGQDIDISSVIHSQNFSIHFRYDLVPREREGSAGWGGVKLSTGYEWNRNEVDLTTKLDKNLSVDTGGSGILEGRLRGRPVFEIETLTHSIPLEAATSFYFLKYLTVFGGLGTDLNFGMSKGKGDIKGRLTPLACTSGVCVGETVLPVVEARANYDAQSQVRNVTFRAFVGGQLDLPFHLHGYWQASQMLGTKVQAVSLGLKYSF